MSESKVYPGGGSIMSSNANKEIISKAKMFDAMQYESEKQDLTDRAYAAGTSDGFIKGFKDFEQRLTASNLYQPIEEGSPEAYEMDANMARGANYGLLDEVENIIQPEYVPEQNQYINEAQQSKDSMMEDAQISAFMAAEAMGDTSEENMNNLLTAELDKRGL